MSNQSIFTLHPVELITLLTNLEFSDPVFLERANDLWPRFGRRWPRRQGVHRESGEGRRVHPNTYAPSRGRHNNLVMQCITVIQ